MVFSIVVSFGFYCEGEMNKEGVVKSGARLSALPDLGKSKLQFPTVRKAWI